MWNVISRIVLFMREGHFLFKFFIEYIIEKLFQIMPPILIVSFLYICIRIIYIKQKKINLFYESVQLLFVAYFTGLLSLVWMPSKSWSDITSIAQVTLSFNFIPSAYYYLIGELTGGTWIKTMIVGNILMFVPMGMLLPVVLRKNGLFEVARFSAIIILAIETIQPFIGRSFDVDDIIYNAVGVAVGFLCYLIVNTIFPAFISKCRAN